MACGMRAVGHAQSIGTAFHDEAMASLMACGGALIVLRKV